ncbi:hypothetical protein SK128_005717 [Halocaridina rubra]|uniref:Nuclear receptor domain-containing protein n=1 Tax=Halocaridina rubra TaxID=373956 RepID=A0AAN8WMM3_HALRR
MEDEQRDPYKYGGTPRGPSEGHLFPHEGPLFPTREPLFPQDYLPPSDVRDPFSFAHDMLMNDGRRRYRTTQEVPSSSSNVRLAITDVPMHFHGARPRVRSPDTEDEAFSPRSWSEGDEGPSYTPLEPPVSYPEISYSSTGRSTNSTPPLDIPSALSSLMSLTTSDYYPGTYPSVSSAEIPVPPSPLRISQPPNRAPTLLTDLPESLISPMRTPKPKRPSRCTETPKSKSSSSSYSRDSYSPTREEMERELEMKKKTCEVCGDVARSLHFGGLACDSCKAFFRRCVISSGYKDFVCSNGENCNITVANRRSCQACRFAGCLKAGMNMSLVQHDPKNSSGKQMSRGSDHPAFQQGAVANYGESSRTPLLRPNQVISRRESTSSSSSGQLYESSEPYNYSYTTVSDDSDIESSKYSYATGGSGTDHGFATPFAFEGKYPLQRGTQGLVRGKPSHPRFRSEGEESNRTRLNASKESGPKTEVIARRSVKEMKSYIGAQDYAEIKKLHNTYVKSFNKISIPIEDTVITENNLGVYYSYFVQSRAKFLLGIPLYKTLGTKDKRKLLQVAVSMSTYIVAAQFVNLDNHVIESKDEDEGLGCGVVMPINTIRQFLTNDQFVEVMMFFSNHSPLYSDMTVSILMQIMGLTYPEPGLTDSVVVEAGRCHYGGLLSRYLTAIHGSEIGQQHFQTLLESQHEARRLAGMLQHLELIHQAPKRDHSSIKKILGEGIRLVYDEAREGLSKSRQDHASSSEYSGQHSEQRNEHQEQEAGDEEDDMNRYEMIENTLKQLACCDDPAVLAEARRILPVDLLKRLSEQLDSPD